MVMDVNGMVGGVSSLAAGCAHSAALVTYLGKSSVLTWGRGEDGQLGHGDSHDSFRPKAVAALADAQPSAVICGAEHTVAICASSNEVYSWGWGDFGRLGHGHTDDFFIPRVISALSGRCVKEVACGDSHTLVVLQGGSLFAFGRNQNGQLGLGDTEDALSPQAVHSLSDTPISGVSCGAEHSVCVSHKGTVYVMGWGRYGNLGLGTRSDVHEPTRMQGLDGINVKVVACGWRHSMMVDDRGRLFTCGWSKYGQLGHGDTNDEALPKQVRELSEKKIATVSGGWRNSIATTIEGQLWVWGWNKFGQLGLDHLIDVSTPIMMPFFRDQQLEIEEAVCGWRHTVVSTRCGCVYSWGLGMNGQLGNECANHSQKPVLVPALSKPTIDMACFFEGENAFEPTTHVPAADRYALVPDSLISECESRVSSVLEVPNADEAIFKRARLH